MMNDFTMILPMYQFHMSKLTGGKVGEDMMPEREGQGQCRKLKRSTVKFRTRQISILPWQSYSDSHYRYSREELLKREMKTRQKESSGVKEGRKTSGSGNSTPPISFPKQIIFNFCFCSLL